MDGLAASTSSVDTSVRCRLSTPTDQLIAGGAVVAPMAAEENSTGLLSIRHLNTNSVKPREGEPLTLALSQQEKAAGQNCNSGERKRPVDFRNGDNPDAPRSGGALYGAQRRCAPSC